MCLGIVATRTERPPHLLQVLLTGLDSTLSLILASNLRITGVEDDCQVKV
jgi:hypothetical protein